MHISQRRRGRRARYVLGDHTREDLTKRPGVVSFNIGDHDHLANDNTRGDWFFAVTCSKATFS